MEENRGLQSMNLLEELATLYFRLNGYFTVPNFLLHQERGRTSSTDIDILAVRFPYQQEIPAGGTQPLDNDPKIVLSNVQLTDVVLAEVKRSGIGFNRSWRELENIKYVLKWVGFTSSEQELEWVATEVRDNKKSAGNNFHFRMILLTGGLSAGREDYIIPLNHVLGFIKERFEKWRLQKREHSPWRGTLADCLFKQVKTGRFPGTMEELERDCGGTSLFTYGALMDPFEFYERTKTGRVPELAICVLNDYARVMNKVANNGVRLNLCYSKGRRIHGILYRDLRRKEIDLLEDYEPGYGLKDIDTSIGKAKVFLASEGSTTSIPQMTERSREYLHNIASIAKRWGDQFYRDFASNLLSADGAPLNLECL